METLNKLQSKIKKEKKKLCKVFKREHKAFLKFLDVLLILAFLMNMGALVCTNALVTKEEPDREFMEANPVMAETHDLKPAPVETVVVVLLMFFKQVLYWTVILFLYIVARKTSYSEGHLYRLCFMAVYVFTLTATDFFHDLGYLIGTML
jgi:hypothetical protein